MQITWKIERRIWHAATVLLAILAFGRMAHADMGADHTSIDFGSQAVGTASSPQTVTLTNFTKNRVSIQGISTSQAQFRVSSPSTPVTLYRGDSLTVSVTFAPTAAQTYSDTLTFISNNSGTVTVGLGGTGTPANPSSIQNSIIANPSSLSFSVQAGRAATTQSVTINDSTLAPLPFAVAADQSWITLSATSGTTQSAGIALQLGANPAGLSAGTYTGHVILTASGVTNSPLAIPVTLNITPIPAVAPSITTQPASTSVIAGNTATFSVAATGTSPMTYQWSKNGRAISGAASSTYTTPAETMADNNAQFSVVVSNSAGTATSNAAVLTVTSPVVAPSITTQPASTSVIAGNTATFSVAATGTSPMTYQWSKNGGAISGAASSTYTTPAETMADNNAQFTVSVSNSAGTATSKAATLTVNAATRVLNSSASSLSFGSVNVSSSSSKNVTLTNAGNSNVAISNVTVTGAGFTASGVSTGLILIPGQSATLMATFAPAASGSVTGSIAVASNATNSPDTITVSGTGAAVVNHSVALSWAASTSAVIGYNTYSSKTSGGPYTKLTSSPVAAMAYTDATVQSGLTYYYVVTSVDSSNMESTHSSEVSATIP